MAEALKKHVKHIFFLFFFGTVWFGFSSASIQYEKKKGSSVFPHIVWPKQIFIRFCSMLSLQYFFFPTET